MWILQIELPAYRCHQEMALGDQEVALDVGNSL